MIIPSDFMLCVKDIAQEEFERCLAKMKSSENCRIGIEKQLDVMMQAYIFSAIIYYHQALKEELLDHGIDIGDIIFVDPKKNDEDDCKSDH